MEPVPTLPASPAEWPDPDPETGDTVLTPEQAARFAHTLRILTDYLIEQYAGCQKTTPD